MTKEELRKSDRIKRKNGFTSSVRKVREDFLSVSEKYSKKSTSELNPVLIVDDQHFNHPIIHSLLNQQGVFADSALSGESALILFQDRMKKK